MRRNYTTVRERLAAAIHRELLREDGAWPAVKKKVRETLAGGLCSKADTTQFADAMAYGVLQSEEVRVIARRKK